MLGYSAEKSWVLLANYLDPTLMMNSIAFELGHRFGLQFTNHANHVELYLNNEYQGNYILTEQIQQGGNRVNIDKKKDFLVELDTYMDEDFQFYTDIIRLPVMVKSPEVKSESEIQFVKDAMKALENSMFLESEGFPDSNYKDLIDINSVVDFIMINEITRNTEFQHPKSMYMYKRSAGKIQMGPLWDFDWGFGYTGQGHNYYTNAQSMLCKAGYTGNQTGYKFFCRFFDDPAFRTLYKNRWNEMYQTQLFTMDAFIDQLSTKLDKSQAQNFGVWNNNLIYENQILRLKEWMKTRLEYLNTEINKF